MNLNKSIAHNHRVEKYACLNKKKRGLFVVKPLGGWGKTSPIKKKYIYIMPKGWEYVIDF